MSSILRYFFPAKPAQMVQLTGTLQRSFSENPTKIYAYTKGIFRDDLVNKGKVQQDGSFTIDIPKSLKDVDLQIVETVYPYAKTGIKLMKQYVTHEKIHFKVTGQPLNLVSTDEVSLSTPAVFLPLRNELPKASYLFKLSKVAIPEFIKRFYVDIKTLFGPVPLRDVQRIFDSFGPKFQKKDLNPRSLLDDLMNGICAVDYVAEGNKIIWEANFDQYDKDSDNLPNVTVIAIKAKDYLNLESIEYKFPDETRSTLVLPSGDPKILKKAIFYAYSAFCTKGEGEKHLGEGHLLPGIVAHYFFKHLSLDNPFRKLLEVHLQKIDTINFFGSKGIIFGQGSVLEVGSLTADSVVELVLDHMAKKTNWKSSKNHIQPINEDHWKAKLSNRFHDAILKVFNAQIPDLIRLLEPKHKAELFEWSKHCVGKMDGFDPFMENDHDVNADTLIDFCTWLVHSVTFGHYSAHSSQSILTDINFATLAMRNHGVNDRGELAYGGNTYPRTAAQQLFIARTILAYEALDYEHAKDQLTDNEYATITGADHSFKKVTVATEI